MNESDTPGHETEAPGDRLSRLSEASLRINESLDFDTVLQGVLASARDLTRSRYGVFILLDDAGGMREFFGSGMTPEQGRKLWPEPDRVRFFDYVGSIQKSLRVRDFHSHARTLGLPEFPPAMTASSFLSFLAAPIRHQGEHLGTIYLDEKEGEYTQEDEEILVMFASQAAMVIANARRYRDEQRARARLETLVDTSPVGVAVFDARTGAPISFNREAVRMMEAVRLPDRPPEELLQVLTVRRFDGPAVSLADLPLAQLLSRGETVRAEEMVLSVPDGRSITVLVNATPLRSEDDNEVETVVVTMQDMTPLEELEKMRAEFLGMVSHELRAPLTSIKGSVDTLLESFNSLDTAEMVQFIRIIKSQSDRMRDLISDLLDVARIETGMLSVAPEPVEAGDLVDEAKNIFFTGGGRRNVTIDMELDLPWVMADRRRIVQVLCNLLSNAARYSPESAPIRVNASLGDDRVEMSVADEGLGVSPDEMPLLFRKFSRNIGHGAARQAPDTGLGLAICKGIVEAHGGRIWAASAGLGQGSTFTFTLPLVGAAVAAVESPALSVRSQTGARNLTRILAVDDDPAVLRYVRDALSRAGYAPVVTTDPNDALRIVESDRPRLVLLDLMLPGSDGIELMKSILEIAEVPVIFLSAYGRDEIIARAIEAGAADYMVKPFSPTELVARVRGALRRRLVASTGEPSEPFVLGDLVIDYAERRVSVAGSAVHMTPTEYELLFELSVHAGRVLTFDALLDRVWGFGRSGNRGSVTTYVKRLRRKLGENADSPKYIFAEPRVGYRMPKGEQTSGEPPATD